MGQARMPWYEYEPLLAYGCTRSRPGVQVGQSPHPYSSYDTRNHSGSTFYPSYRSYIDGMTEGDYFFIGYKPIPAEQPEESSVGCDDQMDLRQIPQPLHRSNTE